MSQQQTDFDKWLDALPPKTSRKIVQLQDALSQTASYPNQAPPLQRTDATQRRQLRTNTHWSQKALAKHTGIPRATLRQWETPGKGISPKYATTITNLYNNLNADHHHALITKLLGILHGIDHPKSDPQPWNKTYTQWLHNTATNHPALQNIPTQLSHSQPWPPSQNPAGRPADRPAAA